MRTLWFGFALLLLISGCTPPISENTGTTVTDTATPSAPAPTLTPATATATEALAPPTQTISATLTPQPTAHAQPPLPGPPDPVAVASCDGIPRPAILFQDVVEIESSQTSYLVLNPEDALWCRLILPNYPADDPVSTQGSLFYPVADLEAGTMTVWQMYPDGNAEPWDVTTTLIEVPYTPFAFAVSPDGSHIAWSTFAPDSANARLVVTLWLARISDEEPQLLLQRETAFDDHWGDRPLFPLRFSADNRTLYFSWAPIGLGGMWTGYYGRYDNLLTLPTDGSAVDGRLVFDCAQEGEFLCLGDFMPGEALAYAAWADDWRIEVDDWNGASLQTIPLAGVGHAGYPTFSPSGLLAFTSANVNDELYPEMTTIYLLAQPLTESSEPVYEAPGIEMLWRWLNDGYLIAHGVEADWGIQTSVIRLEDSRLSEVSNYPYYFIATVP